MPAVMCYNPRMEIDWAAALAPAIERKREWQKWRVQYWWDEWGRDPQRYVLAAQLAVHPDRLNRFRQISS
jgi:hypothetical protein